MHTSTSSVATEPSAVSTEPVELAHRTGGGAIPTGSQRLVVRSIGTADAHLIDSLASSLALTTGKVVRCLYRAPGVLLDGVEEAFAARLCGILRDAGLEVDSLGPDAECPGAGDERDVAFHLRDPARLREVAVVLARFSGIELGQAAQMLLRSPSVVLGGVSEATAQALARRVAHLDVEVVSSDRSQTLYDLVLVDPDPAARAAAVQVLRRVGVDVLGSGPLLALGLTPTQADRVWSGSSQRDAMRLVDRAFQRVDVWLTELPAVVEGDLATELVAQTGMPELLLGRLADHLPLVLHEAVVAEEGARLLERLADLGARAEARVMTFQAFDLSISYAPDLDATVAVLSALLERDEAELRRELWRLPARFVGPFAHPRARWLEAELLATGATVSLEAR